MIFIQDSKDREWFVPVPIKSRDSFDTQEESTENDIGIGMENDSQSFVNLIDTVVTENDDINWVRSDVEGIIIDTR